MGGGFISIHSKDKALHFPKHNSAKIHNSYPMHKKSKHIENIHILPNAFHVQLMYLFSRRFFYKTWRMFFFLLHSYNHASFIFYSVVFSVLYEMREPIEFSVFVHCICNLESLTGVIQCSFANPCLVLTLFY